MTSATQEPGENPSDMETSMTSRQWIPGCAAAFALALPCVGFQAGGMAKQITASSSLSGFPGSLTSEVIEAFDRALAAGKFPSDASFFLERTQVWSMTTSH